MVVTLLKLVSSIIVVVGLSILAEHVSPRIAGILSGFPTGTAIALFFFGLEVSPRFAADSALYNIIGLIAMQAFILVYYKVSLRFRKYSIFLSSLFAILGYFVVVWGLHYMDVNKYIAVSMTTIVMIVISIYFKKIENSKIADRQKLNRNVILLRALISATIILVITGIAKLVGPTWSGLFSAFPTTLFPLILILHFNYGKSAVHTVIKNVPIGLGSLIVYSLVVASVYPRYGVYTGTIIAYTCSIIYLTILYLLKSHAGIFLRNERTEDNGSKE